MKTFRKSGLILGLIVFAVYYYLFIPPINLSSIEFYIWVLFPLGIYELVELMSSVGYVATKKSTQAKQSFKMATSTIVICVVLVVLAGLVQAINSPMINASSYHNRIIIEDSSFTDDVKEANFKRLPLLDKDSSQKLGDRVLGQLPELISQFSVSDEYTQINYNNKIVRVTPLEYNGLIKYIGNRSEGTPGYILVNSTTGTSELIKLDEGMKYMPSAYLNEDLYRHARFNFPFEILGDSSFEIDESGKPFWIIQTISYSGIGLKKEISGVIAIDPVNGDCEKYVAGSVPSWIDNVWDAATITDQLNSWGKYGGGWLNSFFGQKGVKQTTEGYNYLSQDDDIFMYTGITSAAADESNIGFVLVNLRTKEAKYYAVPGAEEYSAMDSARGAIQEKNYTPTFPLLINLQGKATYMLSLKDGAGLVKMYAFVDVQDYQKVTVTDATAGIENAMQAYLKDYGEKIEHNYTDEKTETVQITSLNYMVIDGTTYAYFTDASNNYYRASIKVGDEVAFLNVDQFVTISYVQIDYIAISYVPSIQLREVTSFK